MRTRDEQTIYSIEEALKVLKTDGVAAAMSTFQSHMRSHPETKLYLGLDSGLHHMAKGRFSGENGLHNFKQHLFCWHPYSEYDRDLNEFKLPK